jgi:hypothetical protein
MNENVVPGRERSDRRKRRELAGATSAREAGIGPIEKQSFSTGSPSQAPSSKCDPEVTINER